LTDRATLLLLSALEDGESVTQRGLAARIGVALGLTNSLLKRAAHKGLVKVRQAPAKRFAYYVTPKGFGEKSRLVAEYLSTSLNFFRQARDEYAGVCDAAQSQGHNRVALFGVGELAEIATLSAQGSELEVSAFVQIGSNQSQFSGLPVINNLDAMSKLCIDAVIIASTDAPQDAYELLRGYFDEDQIYIVPLLHVSRRPGGKVQL